MKPSPLGSEAGKNDGSEACSVKVQAWAQSSTSCSFCWFILNVYPTLQGMTTRDGSTFKAHLQKAHGLKEEIQP